MRGNVRQIAAECYKKYIPTLFDSGVGARLPSAYRKFYDEWRNTTPEPVHYIPEQGQWKRKEDGQVVPVVNVPIPGFITKELDRVLTGGEMIIQGFILAKDGNPCGHYWLPNVIKSVVYSEILDKYIEVLMTRRVIKLIHKNYGFDKYILSTKACDLKTSVAVQLKRKLLLTLRDNELPYDEEKNKLIYEKYKQYMLPPEEVEWYGLTFSQACNKLTQMEEAERQKPPVPLKHIYRTQFIEYLKTNPSEEEDTADEQSSWFSKLSKLRKLPLGK